MPNTHVLDIPIDRIITRRQPRKKFRKEDIASMSRTVKHDGVLSPVMVMRQGEQFLLVDGECRLRASIEAGAKTISAIVEERTLSAGEILHRQLLLNCQRTNLTPMELAESISDLIAQTGWSATEVSERLGISSATISRHLALLRLPDAIQRQIDSGEIPASAGSELAQIEDPARQAELAAGLAAGTVTRDGVTGLRRSSRKSQPSGDIERTTRVKITLSERRSVTVVASQLTLDSLIESLEELLAKARRARPQGVSLTTFARFMNENAAAGGKP